MSVDGFTTQISWSDFKPISGDAPEDGEVAYTHALWKLKYGYGSEGNKVKAVNIEVEISIDKNESWVFTSLTSNTYLLKHEQGHYEISALAGRELFNKIEPLRLKSNTLLKEEIDRINLALRQKVKTKNKQYDKLTDHSRIKTAQATWDKAFATEMGKPNGSIDNLPF